MSIFHVHFSILLLILFYCLYVSTSTSTESPYHPCIRACTGNDSMTCYYHFTIEHYVTMGKACDYCRPNEARSQLMKFPNCQCVLADGFERGILTINRMLPGPSIQVCKGDTIVVDVHNGMEGENTAIHWHGVHQRGSQYYDGVPFVTQCPIFGGRTFRYIFKADKSGTHFYHSHSNVQMVDGLYGNLIIRESPEEDVHRESYDEDLPEHVILLSDFTHFIGAERIPGYSLLSNGQFPEAFLINGLGRYFDMMTGEETHTPYEIFTVEEGKRYRFRLINSIGTSCDARFVIEDHPLTVIASDGDDFEPFTVDSIVFYSGERFDVIVNANQTPGAYWIQVISPKGCMPKSVHQLAILRYEGHPPTPRTVRPTYERSLPEGKFYVDVCGPQSERLCIKDLRPIKKTDFDVATTPVDRSLFLPYEVIFYDTSKLFQPDTYMHFLIAPGKNPITSVIDGISFKFPPIPVLSQPGGTLHQNFCNTSTLAGTPCPSQLCICPHTMQFGLHEFVEIMIVDFTRYIFASLPHPFHLHGNSFYVMELGHLGRREKYSKEEAELIWQNYRDRIKNLNPQDRILPVKKDTIVIPHNGYAIIRIKFDNPGFWLFHCHFAYHLTIGMNMIFQVGDHSDLPAVPENFPRCGNYLPPIRL